MAMGKKGARVVFTLAGCFGTIEQALLYYHNQTAAATALILHYEARRLRKYWPAGSPPDRRSKAAAKEGACDPAGRRTARRPQARVLFHFPASRDGLIRIRRCAKNGLS